jgi:pyruvate formate lyase activating enzyme
MRDRPATDPALLVVIAGAAYARGLRHVYVGNVADRVRELSHTRCPCCYAVLIERENYVTRSVALRDGACPQCGARLPGIWA